MLLDDRAHVLCAAITKFDGVFAEDFMQWVCFCEVFFHKSEKLFAEIVSYCSVVRRIVPHDVSAPISTLGSAFFCCVF